jgi:signal transduction histidine kinase/ActR/RegA family two-component response regulator
MRVEPLTLFLSATFLLVFIGLLLACPWQQRGSRRVLRPWGFSILLGAAGIGLMGTAPPLPEPVAHHLPLALIIAATGLAWSAARVFDGAPARRPLAFAGAGAWLAASLLPLPPLLLDTAASALCAAYLAAGAATIWRRRRAEPLASRGTAAVLLAVHAGVVAARALALLLEATALLPAALLPGHGTWAAILLVEAQLHAVGMAMALLAMAQERAEGRAAAALVAARDAAEAASAAKSRFVAHLSHELRTPMQAVLGMAEALAADPRLSPDQKQQAETLERAGRHLVAVAGEVLDLASAEAGKLRLDRRPVPLDALLADCLALARPAAEAKRLALHGPAGPVPAGVLADPTRLRQVVLNLLSNAVKFTPPPGRVELRVRAEGALVRIEVADTGPGIPPAQRGRLFGEYARLGGRAGPAGAGLGLSISRALVQAMGGTIGHAPGPEGSGSVFWIELPAAEPPLPARPAPVAAPPPAARPRRVLVADDVAANRLFLRLLLQRHGHEAVEAADGAEAVAAAAAGELDLVLMDANMPGMDGLEAARRIRALRGPQGRVPILALTAEATPDFAAACREAGMDGCLAKPLDGATLLASLERHAAGATLRGVPA